jgi:hypothetical protein
MPDSIRHLETNFDTYQILKFYWLSEIKTIIVANDAMPPKAEENRPSSAWAARWPRPSTMPPGPRYFNCP